MSLEIERIRIESKINSLKKARTAEELKSEMAIINIRQEADPLLDVLEIGVSRLEIAINNLKEAIAKIQDIDGDIKKLERML